MQRLTNKSFLKLYGALTAGPAKFDEVIIISLQIR